MRARHRHHKLRGEAHLARGGGVHHHPHNAIKGEGAAPKLHAGKRARGGKARHRDPGGGLYPKLGYGDAPPEQRPSGPPRRMLSPLPDDAPDKGQGKARGGGIHIKKSHQGLLHKNLGVSKGKKIPAGKLEKAEHSSDPAVRKRAVFAENAKHWHH